NNTYKLTLAGAGEDNAATGDLDIRGDLKIQGAGMPVIDGNSLDRVFQFFSGKVTIANATIRNGVATQGGGLFNLGANVTLSNVVGTNNQAIGASGGNGGHGRFPGPPNTPAARA